MEGRVLIATGSTGIAAAAVRLAAAEGARIVVATADELSGLELAAEIGAECWIGELARPTAADSVLSLCLSKHGRVDALFNASGLSGRRFGDGPVHECTDEGWSSTLDRNLTTTFYFCRAVVGRMLQQDVGENGIRGTVLNMGSILAAAPEPRNFATHAYAAAKGGVEALTRAMAAYYAPHRIRVNALLPGLVRTPASERAQNPDLLRFLEKKQPLIGGMLEAGDVARAAVFLLGDGARSVTGASLSVDAGWSVTGVS
jgi:NAD(P)-dependent dehydrogenase (short-subunit alcohol dehydrogenase family)